MMQLNSQGWWELDQYTVDAIIPDDMLAQADLWGPRGPAVIRAYENGSTQSGWSATPKNGAAGFAENYNRRLFNLVRVQREYDKGEHAAALVTRSFRGFVVDIDGKNGGLQGVHELGSLPYTKAEISKSKTGYHLFYSAPDEWLDDRGFDSIPDAIGFVQGVDIRGIGCVYHYPQQRWNERPIAEAPAWLIEKFIERKQRRDAAAALITKVIQTADETEILMLHSDLLDELAEPIKNGGRNNTLFAIGAKMKAAGLQDWNQHIADRANEVGLGADETQKLVANIERHG